MKEYIICSAIWVDDGVRRAHLPPNLVSGFVAAGLRHCNCYTQIAEVYGWRKNGAYDPEYFKYKKIEGFLTNNGHFFGREISARIAYQAGQVSKELKELHSEDLW